MKKSLLVLIKILSVLLVAVYLASCFTQYISPAHFWPLTFLALGFPVITASMVVAAIGWLFLNRSITLLLLLLLFVGYKNITSVFATNFSADYNVQKDSNTLRIISWNVRGFDNCNKDSENPDSVRRKMLNFIKNQHADILLLQEFLEYHNENIYSNIQVLRDTLGFKYYYAANDVTLIHSYGATEYGSAIFSKLPLTDISKYLYKRVTLPESLLSASVEFQHKKFRVFTSHLVSMNLHKGLVLRKDEAFKRYDSAFIYGSSRFTKLKYYDKLHSSQASQLINFAAQYSEPRIISGDFNSLPTSNTYYTIKGKMQDAFLEKGFGIGRTYTGVSPTLRIDYVLLDKQFKVVQYYCPRLYLSDHFPVITDFKWR